MKLHNGYSLKNNNTFGVDVTCRFFAEIENSLEIKQLLSERRFRNSEKLILGGGSNVLFTKNFDGLVITQTSSNITIHSEDDSHCFVTADAGVTWHELVQYCVNKNLGGIENLSLIPGKVGAAPIQNIGAYGQELKDVFHLLKGIFIDDLKEANFNLDDCKFGYRESVFKKELKNKFIITEVTLRLDKNPKLNTAYGAIEEELSKLKKDKVTIKDVSDAVCKIRMSKLPDPQVLGNAGSFFKNPEVPTDAYNKLKAEFADLPGHKISKQIIKVPAGWLIEKCGFKGKKFGNVGVHERQALVIVNYGNAIPDEIIKLKDIIKDAVKAKFQIELTEEVNII